MQAGLSTKNAPSPKVVLPHYAYGAFSFLVAAVLFIFSANDLTITTLSPKILSLVHIMVLGWITMVIMGALYQLIPVVMEVKLYNEKLALASFILLALGTPLMVLSFWQSFIAINGLIMIGGTLVILSVILFGINALMSAKRSTVRSIQNRFIVTSIIWFFVAVYFGFSIIVHPQIQQYNTLQIHVSMAVVGWFMQLVVGVSSILMPMFFIAHQLNERHLHRAYWLINGGLILLNISLFFNFASYVNLLATLVILMGFSFFFRYNFEAYRKRLRKSLDVGMKHSVLAFSLLFISLISGLASAASGYLGMMWATKAQLVFGYSLIYGFFSALILGQMYKTLPFIVWLKLYQDKVGKFKTPLPADMHHTKVADAHYWTFLVGFFGGLVGILFSSYYVLVIAGIALFTTALLYAFNNFKILTHRQKLEPIIFPKRKL